MGWDDTNIRVGLVKVWLRFQTILRFTCVAWTFTFWDENGVLAEKKVPRVVVQQLNKACVPR